MLARRADSEEMDAPRRATMLARRADSEEVVDVDALLAEAALLREEIAEEEKLVAAAAETLREARAEADAARDADREARDAAKAVFKAVRKRETVKKLCRNENATRVGLVLLNDNANTRKGVRAALEAADVVDAEGVMMRAHRTGAGLVNEFGDLEVAYDAYAKLNDAKLNVVLVSCEDGASRSDLEALAELRDLADDLDGMDIMNADGTDFNAAWKVLFSGVGGRVFILPVALGVAMFLKRTPPARPISRLAAPAGRRPRERVLRVARFGCRRPARRGAGAGARRWGAAAADVTVVRRSPMRTVVRRSPT